MSAGDWKELFAAACDGRIELVRYHVKNGVDVNYAHPEFLSTPLVACILARQPAVADLLLDVAEQDGSTLIVVSHDARLVERLPRWAECFGVWMSKSVSKWDQD